MGDYYLEFLEFIIQYSEINLHDKEPIIGRENLKLKSFIQKIVKY